MIRTILTSIIGYFVYQLISSEHKILILRRKPFIFYNCLCIFCLYSFFNMLFWNYEVNFLITITIFYILSVTMYYIHEFRGTNLNFSDILSLNTAAEVAGGYKYKIKVIFVVVFLFILMEYVLQIKVFGIDLYKNYHKAINGIESKNIDIYRFFWHEVGQVLTFFISFFILKDKITEKQYDYSLFAGDNEGYIYNFVSSIPIFHKTKYNFNDSIVAAKKFIIENLKMYMPATSTRPARMIDLNNDAYKNYTSKNSDAPHVIVIMNESFGSLHRRVDTNTEVTPYYDSMKGVIKGNLYVNTFGGGTANTEFEFLSGMTIGNYPYPVMPYNSFVKRNKYSLATLFNNLGYKTIAMHPYTATNYHRNKVYKRFGFQELLFLNDFKNKTYVRKFVSDESMYHEIIRRYRVTRAEEKKLFLFGVTMQNHSGYQDFKGAQILSNVPYIKDKNGLDSYLSLMRISDDAIKTLINYFKEETEHVVILFFGDHNASFGTDVNTLFYDKNLKYECTNAFATPFFIYDNKYAEDKIIKGISANFLSLLLLDKAKLPYDNLHHLLKLQYEKDAIFNFHKAKDRETGEMYDITEDRLMILEREYLK